MDNFNRHQSAREYEEHRQLITDTIAVLSKSVTISSIAARGTRLLTELMAEEHNHSQNNSGTSSQIEHARAGEGLAVPKQTEKSLNVAAFVKKFCESDQPPPGNSPIATSHMPLWLQQDSTFQTYTYSQPKAEDMFSASRDHVPYSSYRPSSSYDIPGPGYQLPPAARRQHEAFANPVTQNISESFDIRTVNWFDDLLGLAPSHSI